MRKFVAIFLSLSISLVTNAQTKHDVIEPSILEVRYNVSQDAFTDQAGLRQSACSDVFTLRIGKESSQYFSQNKLEDDLAWGNPETALLQLQEFSRRIKEKDRTHGCAGSGDYIYVDNKQKTITTYTSACGESYVYTEDISDFAWSFSSDSVTTICGYPCEIAETEFRGRNWKVWYCPEISISQGPWKFSGLPGLILKAKCDGFTSIEACAIFDKELSPVTFYKFDSRKRSRSTREKVLKIKNNAESYYPAGTVIYPRMELE